MQQTARQRLVLNRLVGHYGPQHWWQHQNRLADWVSMILVQQTTGTNSERVVNAMMPYMTVSKLSVLPTAQLEQLVRPAGFYRQKTRAIQALLAWYQEHGASLDNLRDVPTPDLRQSLLTIRGVGAETADDMLLYMFDRPVFVADSYARRLFARLDIGSYATYDALRTATLPLMVGVDVTLAQEWHAVIDEHGKVMRRTPDADESWLRVK